ncbi:MAG: restriction endonuclease subunit S, partial [Chloroflexi bacterium]|nr:restriction endonuclease subunit S [Chloroflexota bacterium]
VLISIRAPVGPTNLCPARSCIGRGLAAIRPEGGIPSRFILYSLRATEQELRSNSTGTTFDAIRGEALRSHGIALPPLSEQHRIVAEIETQFTRLDASVAALRRAQANLKRYRASVLKDACEGRLVPSEAELARSEGREYEPAAVLLERILADRRKRWESQEKRRGKYREPSDPDASTLPQLPEGWAWATVEQLSLRIQYGTSRKASSDAEGVPVLRMGNIQEGALDFSDLKYLPSQDEEVEKTLLNPGDLVFNRTNSPELVGKSAVYKESHPSACFASYLIRVAFPEACLPDYVCFFINSQHGRAYIAQVRSQQVGQANVNGTKLAAIPIPLPPLAEQWRIVAEVERQLSVMQQAEATVDASLARAERLRQSILKQAFSGKLVPQDPGDEPASALLERIRAEREAEAQASLAVKGKAGQRGKRKAAA